MDMKRKALESLRKDFKSKAYDEKLESPMEVTVGADSEEGLEEGLDLAKDVVKEGPESLMKKKSFLDEELEDEDELDFGMSKEDEASEIMEKLKASPELMKLLMEKMSL